MKDRPQKDRPQKTSWEGVGNWYNDLVGEKGHYYHQSCIIPGVMKLFDFTPGQEAAVLDLACGQGILSRSLPKNVHYTGIDISPTLIKAAKAESPTSPKGEFIVGDVTKPLALKKKDYSHSAVILAMQNIEYPEKVLASCAEHLGPQGKLVLVLNHPCFRIPRQSSWGIDEQQKTQYRRIDRYCSDMKIPIQAHPGKKGPPGSTETWSFHHPLASYSQWLKRAGFQIALIEEWCSDKVSTGKNAKMENRSRSEIPLFMAILAIKM
jgi:SAM-dependent methyltransferase